MKIKFIFDIKYDIDMIVYMLRSKRWKQRASKMGLSDEIVDLIHNASEKNLPQAIEQLKKEVEKTYSLLQPYMKYSKDEYQRTWNEIVNEFSDLVEQKTHKWFYKEYTCIVTNYNSGVSNWNGNVVARWWKENTYTQRRITAHEILLAHYFSIVRNNYKDSNLTDRQIWALAEISSFALTGLDEDIRKFWPWDTRGYYTDHNYPELVELQNALKEPFINRKSFDEYIEKGIFLVKKMYKTD